MKLFSLLVIGVAAVTSQAGEIRSDDPCVLASVRSAFAQATLDRTEGASSEELEAGLTLDVDSQYSTRFEKYSPQVGYYVVTVDATLNTTKTYRYEAYVEQSADLKTCKVKSLKPYVEARVSLHCTEMDPGAGYPAVVNILEKKGQQVASVSPHAYANSAQAKEFVITRVDQNGPETWYYGEGFEMRFDPTVNEATLFENSASPQVELNCKPK